MFQLLSRLSIIASRIRALVVQTPSGSEIIHDGSSRMYPSEESNDSRSLLDLGTAMAQPTKQCSDISAEEESKAQIGDADTNLTNDYFGSTATSPGDKEHRRCLDALFLTDPLEDRKRILLATGDRSKGTCEWITSPEEYKVWLAAKKTNLLWICGQPGQGKTYLSTYLAEILASSKDAILLEYYCNGGDEKRNTASAVTRGLMFGLLNQLPELSQCLVTELDGKTNKLVDDSFAAVWSVFNRMIQISGKSVSCVLDGFDECDNTSVDSLVTRFKELFLQVTSTNSYLKIALTSRPLSKTNSTILNLFPNIMLDKNSQQGQSCVKSDVKIFVEAKFSQNFSLDSFQQYFNDETQRNTWYFKMKAELVEMADETFLWAELAVQELRNKNPFEMEEVLKTLPKGLDAMYDRVLHQIKERHTDTQQKQIASIQVKF